MYKHIGCFFFSRRFALCSFGFAETGKQTKLIPVTSLVFLAASREAMALVLFTLQVHAVAPNCASVSP